MVWCVYAAGVPPLCVELLVEKFCCKRCWVLRLVSRSSRKVSRLADGWFHAPSLISKWTDDSMCLHIHIIYTAIYTVLLGWCLLDQSTLSTCSIMFLRPFNRNVSSWAAVASVGCSASKLCKSFEAHTPLKTWIFHFKFLAFLLN